MSSPAVGSEPEVKGQSEIVSEEAKTTPHPERPKSASRQGVVRENAALEYMFDDSWNSDWHQFRFSVDLRSISELSKKRTVLVRYAYPPFGVITPFQTAPAVQVGSP